MSWPVRIILPVNDTLRIKWRRWFFAFLAVFIMAAMVGGVIVFTSPTDIRRALVVFCIVFFTGMSVYLICLAVRVYYYGVCLSVSDTYKQESILAKKEWTKWASRRLFVSAYHLFIPSEISESDIALAESVAIYNEQQLRLRGHDGQTYSEEQLLYELLASVRVKLKELAKTCIFDVIFTYGNSHATFSIFKECWVAIGLPENKMKNCSYLNGNFEQEFDRLLSEAENKVVIFISANVESVAGYSPELTEFASIVLMNSQVDRVGCVNSGVVLRTMASGKEYIDQELILMKTYQPEMLQTSKIFFSNMHMDEILNVSGVLRESELTDDSKWVYETQNLNLVLGKLGDEHFWLVFTLALSFTEKTKEAVMMIAAVGNEYVCNVIKAFDNNREL
ncbi:MULTISPECIES: hypothetical protein [Citrobacter]|uniref:hypothetical protein n=1 Tax=Citrobacter TaxID=544 RepID=UPI0006A9E64E|nr:MULTISPECIES: hypothetical protein [Citrobacter]QLY01616.1 hypothetical protein HV243_03610 [Citrobacter sp. RHBSTW-00599]WFY32032.1 hypothetical protein NFK28_03915 [Citrobacter braakii]